MYIYIDRSISWIIIIYRHAISQKWRKGWRGHVCETCKIIFLFPPDSLHKPIQHASCMMYSPIILGRHVGWWMLKVRDIGPHWLVNQSTPMVSTVTGLSNQPQWEPCGPQIIAPLHVEYVSNIVAHRLWILWYSMGFQPRFAWMFCTSRSSSGPKPQPRLPPGWHPSHPKWGTEEE